MSYYVVLYVGYEGIEAVLHVTADKEEAVRKVSEFRAVAEENAKLDDEVRCSLPWPQGRYYEPERVCVMTQGEDGEYECCCGECGVSTGKMVLY